MCLPVPVSHCHTVTLTLTGLVEPRRLLLSTALLVLPGLVWSGGWGEGGRGGCHCMVVTSSPTTDCNIAIQHRKIHSTSPHLTHLVSTILPSHSLFLLEIIGGWFESGRLSIGCCWWTQLVSWVCMYVRDEVPQPRSVQTLQMINTKTNSKPYTIQANIIPSHTHHSTVIFSKPEQKI